MMTDGRSVGFVPKQTKTHLFGRECVRSVHVSGQRCRHSLDVLASSTYAAAHLYIAVPWISAGKISRCLSPPSRPNLKWLRMVRSTR
jgi:hypothetical protein